MPTELVLCVPGPWKDRSEFLRTVVSTTGGEYMFAGMILATPAGNDHIPLELRPREPGMRAAFELAGQGRLAVSLLEQIEQHQTTAYLRFAVPLSSQRPRLASFTGVLQRCGGMAIKVESAGIAHQWDAWSAILASDNPFDWYRSFVVLIADSDYYYSCGMHHFGLPEVEVSRSMTPTDAADLMNRFNYWQIVEEPTIQPGHTFSVAPDSSRYRITHLEDPRYGPDDVFHNASGVWRLMPAPG